MRGVTAFRAPTPYGDVVGEISGTGPEVLLLHGGPGFTDYLGGLASEIDDRYTVARYTQRGVAPSSDEGPVDVVDHVADVVHVVDHLGWERPILAGHSWGGNLVLHVLTRHAERFAAGLVLDPLGAVGDGGMAEFAANLEDRLPERNRPRIEELNRLEEELGGLSIEQDLEAIGLFWPAYFPDPECAPPMGPLGLSARRVATWHDMMNALPVLADRLAGCTVPTTFVHGGRSPMPLSASTESAALMTRATVTVLDDAGHFLWIDSPGAVGRALDELVQALV